jgi:hypothetical protein
MSILIITRTILQVPSVNTPRVALSFIHSINPLDTQ